MCPGTLRANSQNAATGQEDAASVHRYSTRKTVKTPCQAREEDAASVYGSTGTV